MKVHLIRSTDFEEIHFENVLNLLSAYPGAIEFIQGGEVILPPPSGEKVFPKPKNFEKQKKVDSEHFTEARFNIDYSSVKEYVKPVFPYTRKYYTWDVFFKVTKEYRDLHSIDKNDFVFLLTNEYNENNWFAFTDSSLRNIFVHTDDWPWFFGMNTDVRFPIAYEIAAWILKNLLFRSQREVIDSVHSVTVGCVNDFCQNKKDITFKMRTADVCDECMKEIEERDIPPHYLNQLFSIFDGIRSNLMFRKRAGVVFKDSRIKFEIETKKIYLVDFGNLDVRLNPKEMSLYLLFLKYPTGLALNSLSEYQEELISFYYQMSTRGSVVEMQNTIYLLTNYLEGELNTTISRIKNKFKKALGDNIAKNYFIQLLPSGVHGIPLNRELIIVE